jgi:hypothetical protein
MIEANNIKHLAKLKADAIATKTRMSADAHKEKWNRLADAEAVVIRESA